MQQTHVEAATPGSIPQAATHLRGAAGELLQPYGVSAQLVRVGGARDVQKGSERGKELQIGRWRHMVVTARGGEELGAAANNLFEGGDGGAGEGGNGCVR
jgi:hypothetical protein